jgi:hypothetical protein
MLKIGQRVTVTGFNNGYDIDVESSGNITKISGSTVTVDSRALKIGQRVVVLSWKHSGKVVVEGLANIVMFDEYTPAHTNLGIWAFVEFDGDDTLQRRFIDYDAQKNTAEYLAGLNEAREYISRDLERSCNSTKDYVSGL